MAHDIWHGAHRGITAQVTECSISVAKDAVSVSATEMVQDDWLYDPIPIPASVEADRRRHPEHLARLSLSLVNPDGTTRSGGPVTHALTLARRGASFVVVADAYIELFYASPDVPGGAGRRSFPSPGGSVPVGATAPSAPLPRHPAPLHGQEPAFLDPLHRQSGLSSSPLSASAAVQARHATARSAMPSPRGRGRRDLWEHLEE